MISESKNRGSWLKRRFTQHACFGVGERDTGAQRSHNSMGTALKKGATPGDSRADVFKFETRKTKWRTQAVKVAMAERGIIPGGRKLLRVISRGKKCGRNRVEGFPWKKMSSCRGFKPNTTLDTTISVIATSQHICCPWNIAEGKTSFSSIESYFCEQFTNVYYKSFDFSVQRSA